MSRYASYRRPAKGRANLIAAAALALMTAAGGLVVVAFEPDADAPARDQAGCLAAPADLALVAVEAGAAAAASHLRDAPVLATRVFDGLPPEGRLAVYKLDAATGVAPRAAIDLCAPAEPAGGGLGAPSQTFLETARQRSRDAVAAAVDAAIRDPGADGWSDGWTDGFDAGLAALLDDPRLGRMRAGARTSLTLVSAFDAPLAPSLDASLGGGPDASLGGGLGAETRLRGVDVSLIALVGPGRDPERATADLARWRAALTAEGAQVDPRIRRIDAPRPPRRDAAGCLATPRQEHLFLIDVTDPYVPGQWNALREELIAAAADLAPNEVLEAHRLTETVDAAADAPALRLCAPGPGPDGAVDGAARDLFLAAAARRIDAALVVPADAKASPIMQNVAALFRNRTRARDRTRVTLFSDGLFNADGVTFFENGQVAFAEVADRAAVRGALADLSGTSARILYARRDSKGWTALQNDAHRRFLIDWLAAQGARIDAAGLIEIDET